MPDPDDFNTIDEAAFERWRADRRHRRRAVWLWVGLVAALIAAALLVCYVPAVARLAVVSVLVAVFVALYLAPTLVARHPPRHHNADAILALNLLLGWTVLGWIAALIWAYTRPPAGRREDRGSRIEG